MAEGCWQRLQYSSGDSVIARLPLNSEANGRRGIAMAVAAEREETLTVFPYRATQGFVNGG